MNAEDVLVKLRELKTLVNNMRMDYCLVWKSATEWFRRRSDESYGMDASSICGLVCYP